MKDLKQKKKELKQKAILEELKKILVIDNIDIMDKDTIKLIKYIISLKVSKDIKIKLLNEDVFKNEIVNKNNYMKFIKTIKKL